MRGKGAVEPLFVFLRDEQGDGVTGLSEAVVTYSKNGAVPVALGQAALAEMSGMPGWYTFDPVPEMVDTVGTLGFDVSCDFARTFHGTEDVTPVTTVAQVQPAEGDEETVARLAVTLRNADPFVLALIVADVKTTFLNETHRTAVPAEAEPLIRKLASIAFNGLGNEGLSSESYAGVSESFMDDLPTRYVTNVMRSAKHRQSQQNRSDRSDSPPAQAPDCRLCGKPMALRTA